jgi:hypothetical protein
MKIMDANIKNPAESRKENLLNAFEHAGKKSSSNLRCKF